MKLSKSIISTESSSAHLKSEADMDFAQDLELKETREFVCGEAQHGLRIDNALVQLVSEFSRSYLQAID